MPRQPLARARVTGAAAKNPQRLRDRTEPASAALGAPSPHLDTIAKQAFDAFKQELPWLTEGDRALVEIAAVLRGRVTADPLVSVATLRALAAVLTKLGATPTDRSRIAMQTAEDEPDEFFGRC